MWYSLTLVSLLEGYHLSELQCHIGHNSTVHLYVSLFLGFLFFSICQFVYPVPVYYSLNFCSLKKAFIQYPLPPLFFLKIAFAICPHPQLFFSSAGPRRVEFLGQQSNPSRICYLHCSCSNTRSLTQCPQPGMEAGSQHSRVATNRMAPQQKLHVCYF